MYEEFFKAIYNMIVVLGGKDELLSIIEKDMPLDELTKRLQNWNSAQLDKLKEQILKFKGTPIIPGD